MPELLRIALSGAEGPIEKHAALCMLLNLLTAYADMSCLCTLLLLQLLWGDLLLILPAREQ